MDSTERAALIRWADACTNALLQYHDREATRARGHLMDHEKTKCIETTFDVNSDAQGKDPDKYSPTLRRYHRKLWSKELPC